MSEVVKTFEDLDAWKTGREVRRFAAKIAKSLPREEMYELSSQMRRSARSVTANIAEGYGRFHYRENVQYCRQARGSLYETLDHFIAADDEGLIGNDVLLSFRELFEKAVRVLNGYIRYLDESARSAAGRSRVREESSPYEPCDPPEDGDSDEASVHFDLPINQ
jgi:four helix bundle protein